MRYLGMLNTSSRLVVIAEASRSDKEVLGGNGDDRARAPCDMEGQGAQPDGTTMHEAPRRGLAQASMQGSTARTPNGKKRYCSWPCKNRATVRRWRKKKRGQGRVENQRPVKEER